MKSKLFLEKNYICNACSFENKQNETLFQASQNTKYQNPILMIFSCDSTNEPLCFNAII